MSRWQPVTRWRVAVWGRLSRSQRARDRLRSLHWLRGLLAALGLLVVWALVSSLVAYLGPPD